MTRRRMGLLVVAAGVLTVAGVAGARLIDRAPVVSQAAGPVVPTARVTRGALTLTVYLQGELRATRQANLTAPAVGGALRILHTVDPGTMVRKDDVIMEFDPADQEFALEQAESELLESEQELIKRRAEIRAQEAQDKVALLTAQFDVRRAALEAAVDADLVAANTHRIRQAELEEAKRSLEKLGNDIAARARTSKASLAVLQEKKGRSEMAADRARQNMDNLVLRAPMDGVISLRDNMDAAGGMFWEGMSLPAYRAGDTVASGRLIADIHDLATMEIRARVNEQERANVTVGQEARLEADTVPGLAARARVTTVSGLGRADMRAGPLRQFDVVLDLLDPDARLKPGTTVRVLVEGGTIDDMLVLPRQALFDVDGQSTVYTRARAGEGFVPRVVKVLHRTEGQVAVEGIDEGVEVALVDPVAAMKLGSSGASGSTGPMEIGK
jgi:HlyD family secretion protein